jgi:negative regulator of flagellin synthesis FlgM
MYYVDLKVSAGLPLTSTTGRSAVAGDAAVGTKINGLDARPVRISAGTPVSKVGQDGAAPQTNADPTSTGGTEVQITGAARNLAALEQQIRDLPAVNPTAVAAVRQKLDDGTYQIDPQRIADRLMGLERDLYNGKNSK